MDSEKGNDSTSYSLNKPNGSSGLKSDKARFLVTLCILLTEMCERLTYYSVVANMILFGTSKLGFSETDATTINQVFAGFVYIVPIFGGFLSDSYFGRFKTICASCLIYLIGLVLIPAASIEYDKWGWEELSETGRRGLFMSGLVFVALGTGGIKANVGPFGAEQVESMGKEVVQSFFNWFYWVINVGALIAYAGVSYIQQEISFAWGFFVPLASMFIALLIFISAGRHYKRTEPTGSVISFAWSILRKGCCKPSPHPNQAFPVGHNKKMLASAKKSYGGTFEDYDVDGLFSVIKLSPFFILVIMYWAIYNQMNNSFYVQGERMDARIGSSKLPIAALNVFNSVSIVIFIPVVDRLLYPCFEKIGKPLTYLKRIGIGFTLAAMSMVVAGIVEIYRKDEMESGGFFNQSLAKETFNASTMSIFVQVPQFVLVGTSEIFTSITSLEFAYNQSPVVMQGLVTGLFLAASGVGNWLSTAITQIVQAASKRDPWWGDEINDVHLEYLLFLFAGLMGINFIVFCIVSHGYTYQDPSNFEKQPEEEKDELTNNEEMREFTNGSYKKKEKYKEDNTYLPTNDTEMSNIALEQPPAYQVYENSDKTSFNNLGFQNE